ncbi:MAG: rubredoxin [Candidatus Hodarchaeota archaeon]
MRYICTNCNIFVYDEDLGDEKTGLKAGTKLGDFPEEWFCPACGAPKSYLKPISDEEFKEKKARYDDMVSKKAI